MHACLRFVDARQCAEGNSHHWIAPHLEILNTQGARVQHSRGRTGSQEPGANGDGMANSSQGLANRGLDPLHLSRAGAAMVTHRSVVTKQVHKDEAGPRSGQEIKSANQGQDQEDTHPGTVYLKTQPRDRSKVRT